MGCTRGGNIEVDTTETTCKVVDWIPFTQCWGLVEVHNDSCIGMFLSPFGRELVRRVV